MAEALKTFREGEDILASETNENNQFLLSKLSDNAAQVQQYVEGEVATIKSNVSSVQATLQNNIDELAAKFPIYIIESAVDGTSGYVLYNNNFHMEWGTTQSVDGTTTVPIKFLKPFTTNTYTVAGSASSPQSAGDKSNIWRSQNLRTDGFDVVSQFEGWNGPGVIRWLAVGF
jgi:hypothetical protein